jgi:hypothetical protein
VTLVCEALEKLAEDDSLRVRGAARQALECYQEQQRKREQEEQDRRVGAQPVEPSSQVISEPAAPLRQDAAPMPAKPVARHRLSQMPWWAWYAVLFAGGIGVMFLIAVTLGIAQAIRGSVSLTPTAEVIARQTQAAALKIVWVETAQALTQTPVETRLSEKDGMVLVYLPAGEFLMGSAENDSEVRQAKNFSILCTWMPSGSTKLRLRTACMPYAWRQRRARNLIIRGPTRGSAITARRNMQNIR